MPYQNKNETMMQSENNMKAYADMFQQSKEGVRDCG